MAIVNEQFGTSNGLLVLGVGFATFFFGFGAGALLNVYLVMTNSEEIANLRTTLSFRSAIYGDGVILPILNMIAVATIQTNKDYMTSPLALLAIFLGLSIAVYFHVGQAVNKLVNWTMPRPWHWNLLGLWHAIYMLVVATLLSLYFLLSIVTVRRTDYVPSSLIIAILGMMLFFVLLATDYIGT